MKLPVIALVLTLPGSVCAQRQMEALGRGLVAIRTGNSSVFLGWRMLGQDDDAIAFHVYRAANAGAPVRLTATPLSTVTSYTDNAGTTLLNGSTLTYTVRPVMNGVEQAASAPVVLPANSPVRQYLPVPLAPAPGPDGPYDTKFAWVGDLDGNGEYDLVCDRLSTRGEKEQFLDAMLVDGTFLWRLHMGPNSVAQANAYEPGASAISVGDCDNVTVYDVDGDGRAEVIVRTANGVRSTDAAGNPVEGITAADNSAQFLTVFDGMTGAVRARAPLPNHWQQHGTLNGKCFIACLDGRHPSIVHYGYNRADAGPFYRQWTAWDFVNGALVQRWTWAQDPAVQHGSEGHQIRIADVDNDGKDEIVDIGHVMDDTGVQLYTTELTHGDRFHVADINPDIPGLEMYAIQQLNPTFLATAYMQAATGTMLRKWYSGSMVDVGRGIALDITPAWKGLEMYSTQPHIYNAAGAKIYENNVWAPEGLWWDGDPGREFLDGAGAGALSPVVNKFNPATGNTDRLYTIYNDNGGVHQAYGGRAAFWGDILGDWREEIVLVSDDYAELRIYTTKTAPQDRRRTLMHNAQYRLQATTKGYVQASFPDYYLGYGMAGEPPPPVNDTDHIWTGTTPAFTTATCGPGESILFDMSGNHAVPVALTGTLTPSRVKVFAPVDYTFSGTAGSFAGSMKLVKAGAGNLTMTGTHTYTGTSTVWDGALTVNGTLTSSPVTVYGGTWGGALARGLTGGRLAGTGTLAQPVVLAWRGAITPGAGMGSVGTLDLGGGLTCQDGSVLAMDLAAGTADRIRITGNLTLNGATTLVLRPVTGSPVPGSYTLLTYTGSLSGSLSSLAVDLPAGTPWSLGNPAGSIVLTIPVTRGPAVLTWQGGAGGDVWDVFTTPNFQRSGLTDRFVAGDAVSFTDAGAAHPVVNLAAGLPTAGVTVNATQDYTFRGPGQLAGSGGLTKSGSGMLTLSGGHTFTGPVRIAGGVLSAETLEDGGKPSSLGAAAAVAGNLVMDGGTLRLAGPQANTNRPLRLDAAGGTLDTPGETLQISGALTGSGALTKTGAGLLILASANSYTGGTFLDGGRLQLATDTANAQGLGSGPVTFRGGTLSMSDIRDVSSSGTSVWALDVPAGQTGRLNADGRCRLRGTLTGAGDFTFYTPYVRTDLGADWSAFRGTLHVVTDADGGDLRLDAASGFGGSTLDLGDGVVAYYLPALSGNLTLDIGALSGSADAVLLGGPTDGRTLTWRTGGKGVDSVFAGTIADTGAGKPVALTKIGPGVLTLTGALGCTGATTISGGTLRLDGTSAASDFTVQGGGALGGSGSLVGNVRVEAGGTLEWSGNPLAITGSVSLGSAVTLRSAADPGPGTWTVATVSGSVSGSPVFTWVAPDAGRYVSTFSTAGGRISMTLARATDADGDLLPDAWELSWFPDLAATPLGDPDGDGFNNWLEWIAGTDPCRAASVPGTVQTVTTADGAGFDGSLAEVNYSGVYDGGFFTDDTTNYRNNTYQNNGVRHYLTLWKFDLSAWAGAVPSDASLTLTVNGSTTGQKARTLSVFTGNDALITPALRYDAANPFIVDSYVPETGTDTDFDPATVSTVLSYANGNSGGTDVIGAGNPAFLGAVRTALAGDGFLTLLLSGGSTQYLTQGDEDPAPARRPTLTLTLPAVLDEDADGDGMADAWEAENFGTLTRTGAGDADADGTPDWLEEALGLAPRDGAARFAAALGAGRVMSWPSAPGLTFTVERSGDLISWQTVAVLAGVRPGQAWTIPAVPGRYFFRVRVQR